MQTSVKNLSYDEKKNIYAQLFSLGFLNRSKNVNDKLILISLISLTYLKMQQKNPKIRVIDILKSITKQEEDNSSFYNMLEALSIIVEDHSYDCTTADNCGLKSSQEIINKIKEILDSWTPF